MAKKIVAMPSRNGGRGSRLYALTQKTAKPAVSLAAKYRPSSSGRYRRGLIYFEPCPWLTTSTPEHPLLWVHRLCGSCLRHEELHRREPKLIDEKNLNALFEEPRLHLATTTAPPVTSPVPAASNSANDGCVIEKAPWRNCVLFRGVKVKRFRRRQNCVLMQDTGGAWR